MDMGVLGRLVVGFLGGFFGWMEQLLGEVVMVLVMVVEVVEF